MCLPHNLPPTGLELLNSKYQTKVTMKQGDDGFHIVRGSSPGVLLIANLSTPPSSALNALNICGNSNDCLA